MRRIWVDPSIVSGSDFELSGDAFRHAFQVSRFQVGEEFEIVSGNPDALIVRVAEIGKKSARVQVIGQKKLAEIKKPYLGLAYALPKWSVFEEVVEKSVELGVSFIQPLLTDHSFFRDIKDVSESRRERWQKIIQGATEQCGRGPLMEIKEPKTLREFISHLNQNPQITGLFAYEGATALDLKTQLKTISPKVSNEIWAIIGAEGGFSEREVELLDKSGLPPVTIGPQILRSETACFAIMSVIKYELGLMR